MAFVDQLRTRSKAVEHSSNGIDMPSSRKFDPNAWQAAFQATTDGSSRDRSAFEAGLFVDEQLAQVRGALKRLEHKCKQETTAERCSALVGFLNTECTRPLAQAKEFARQANGRASLEQMLFGRLVPGVPGAPGYTPEEVSELLTDCVRHPLRAAIASGGHGSRSAWRSPVDASRAVDVSIQLAQRYDMYEKLWAHVRWLDSAFHAEGKLAVFDETAGNLAADELLNRARRTYGFNRTGLASLASDLPLNHDVPLPKCVLTVADQDSRQLQCVPYDRAPTIVQELTRSALLNWAMSSTISYTALLEMRHSSLGCRIGDLLDVWIQLAVVAFQCQMRLVHRFEDEGLSLASDPLAATSFEANELKALLAQATGIDLQVVTLVINRFTFGRDGVWTADLWERPLVQADDRMLLAWPPLVAGSVGRLIPVLIRGCKDVSDAYAKRGHEFENQVVNSLRLAASASRRTELREAVVLSARLDPEDERVGDVDCVVVVGDTAFCLECRSVKHAATAYEQWDVADDLLNKKAGQALRKRDYLRSNRLLLSEIAASQGAPLKHEITRYVAVVVSNCFLFEGSRELEPFFVHVDTLVSALLGGPAFGAMESGSTVSLFVDRFVETASAGEAIAKELRSPAKAEYYHSLLTPTKFEVPASEGSDKPITVFQLTVSPPTNDTISTVLQKCSFAPLLRRLE